MAEVQAVVLPESDRVELEKFCQYLLTFYVRMLEKPKADQLIKGSLMSTQQQANGCSSNSSIGVEGSSVDLPSSSGAEIASILQEVHHNIPELEGHLQVPAQLPEELTQQPFQVTLQDIEGVYPPEQAEAIMESDKLTSVQVFMLYLRSFRNCMECDPGSILQGVGDEVARHSLQIRIIGYLAIMLADVTEVCYPNRKLPAVMAELMSDLSKYRNQRS